MKDKCGRIKIPGFYDDVVRAAAGRARGVREAAVQREESTGRTSARRKLFGETGYTTLERIWGRPTFEVNGLLVRLHRRGRQDRDPGRRHGQGQHAPGAQPGSEEDRRPVRGVHQEGRAEDGGAEADAHARRQAVDDGVRQPVRAGGRPRHREGLRPDARSSTAKAARFRSSRRSRRSSGCRACCSASDCPTRTRTRRTRSSISATSTTASSRRRISTRRSAAAALTDRVHDAHASSSACFRTSTGPHTGRRRSLFQFVLWEMLSAQRAPARRDLAWQALEAFPR